MVLGFPANDFGGQEPGTDEEIAEFCHTNYAVDFPLFSKISVVGDGQHPLYAELTARAPTAEGGKEAFRENLRSYGMTPTEIPTCCGTSRSSSCRARATWSAGSRRA
jgi:glutathione peroxidase